MKSDYANTGITAQSPPSYALHKHICLTLNRTDRTLFIGTYEFKLSGNSWRDTLMFQFGVPSPATSPLWEDFVKLSLIFLDDVRRRK